MNEIQKANAKVAIEYFQKILDGKPCTLHFEGKDGLLRSSLEPDFTRCDVRYFWPQKMVEHKGGSYPKPVAAEDIVIVNRCYYVADPLDDKFFEHIAGPRTGRVFKRHVNRGIIHETKEAAIAHAKVMLGVSDE